MDSLPIHVCYQAGLDHLPFSGRTSDMPRLFLQLPFRLQIDAMKASVWVIKQQLRLIHMWTDFGSFHLIQRHGALSFAARTN